MENDLKKLRAKFKKLFSGRKLGDTAHNPTQSWLRIVVLASCAAVVLCCIGVYEFFFEQRMQEPVTEITNFPQNTLTKEHIEEVAVRYREQTARFVELRSTLPEIPDTGITLEEEMVVIPSGPESEPRSENENAVDLEEEEHPEEVDGEAESVEALPQ